MSFYIFGHIRYLYQVAFDVFIPAGRQLHIILTKILKKNSLYVKPTKEKLESQLAV